MKVRNAWKLRMNAHACSVYASIKVVWCICVWWLRSSTLYVDNVFTLNIFFIKFMKLTRSQQPKNIKNSLYWPENSCILASTKWRSFCWHVKINAKFVSIDICKNWERIYSKVTLSNFKCLLASIDKLFTSKRRSTGWRKISSEKKEKSLLSQQSRIHLQCQSFVFTNKQKKKEDCHLTIFYGLLPIPFKYVK